MIAEQEKQERQAFETWISSPPFEKTISRHPDDETVSSWPGQYHILEVELAWQAWLERTRKEGVTITYMLNRLEKRVDEALNRGRHDETIFAKGTTAL